MLAIEGALQTRRDQQQEQYVSLATKLDRMGKQLEEARKESTTDPLTGIGNRKLFDMMGPRAVQMFALGAIYLSDKRKVPLIPKWLAWYGIWVGFSFVAELLMPFFKSGIFARSGTLNFWIEFLIWMVWVPVLTYFALSAITRVEQEHAAG